MPINLPAPGRYPLCPGRPLVFRCRRRTVWGFYCECTRYGRTRALSSEQPNYPTQAAAMNAAVDHVAFWHKTRAQLETEALEAAFAAPAYDPEQPSGTGRPAPAVDNPDPTQE